MIERDCLRFLLAGLLLAVLNSVASADDTFTQIGTWTCSYPNFRPDQPFVCPFVKFPTPYGATPSSVFVNPVQTPGGAIQPSFRVAPDGFTPILGSSPGHGSGTINGSWIVVGSPPAIPGEIDPRYIVLLVAYTPPGTNGGKSTSSVVYESGSSAGTTTSVSETFKQTYKVAADTGAGFFGNGGSAGLSFSYSQSVTNSQSLDIKKGTDTKLTIPGPSIDGIDHNRDFIYLWLNPKVKLSLTSSSAVWTFIGTATAAIQYVQAGWLVNPACEQDNAHPECMPDNVRQTLSSYGVTEQDFPDILMHDVLASGGALDPNRFQSLNSTFPYEPPYAPTDPVPTVTYQQSSSTTTTVGTSVMDSYALGLTVATQGSFLDLVKASLKNTDTWEWTDKSSVSTSTGHSESATVTVGGPGYGYTGPTMMGVYYDSIYKTFAFAPVTNQPIGLQGKVVGAKQLFGNVVSLVVNRVKFYTLTNARGEWKFYGAMNGPCIVESIGITQQVPECATNETLVLQPPQ